MHKFLIQMTMYALMVFLMGCGSAKTASYRYTQKQLEQGNLDFDTRLRVDEYVNAFPQSNLTLPRPGEDVTLRVDFFTNSLPSEKETTLAQVMIRSRRANRAERSKKFGISLVLDVSGSMMGEKFQDSKESILAMISELANGTEFSLIAFSNDAQVVVPPTKITSASRELIARKVDKLRCEGGTDIEAGLVMGYQMMAQFSENTRTRLLLLTDGQSNIGNTSPEEIAKLAGVRYIEGARISTIGLGLDVDEDLLRTVSEKGRGNYYFAENAKSLKDLLRRDVESLMIPIAKEVKTTITASKSTRILKVYGTDSPIENNTVLIDSGELNSDDWRIFFVEVGGTGGELSIAAEASYFSISKKRQEKKSVTKKNRITKGTKPKLNEVVARNSVVFSNAMALIEISKLNKQGEYKNAEDIAAVQIANLEVARSFDKSKELEKEYKNMWTVKRVMREKQDLKPEYLKANDGSKKDSSTLKSVVKTAIKIGQETQSGPWSLVLGLIGLALE